MLPGSIWIDWQRFIFLDDTHQEAFTVGLSTRFKLNAPSSTFHCYIPLQILAQHRGGEIDTIRESSVQTLMNGAVGAGVTWNIDRRILKRVNVELDAAGYYQRKVSYGLIIRALESIVVLLLIWATSA